MTNMLDDMYDELDHDDYPDLSDDEFNEYDDERAALRGTSQCDGLCIPQCSWCMVAHYCPDECAGGVCPYDTLDKRRHDRVAHDESFDIEF
jgi:hypothetical protein